MDESKLLERITVNPDIFGGKPIIRGRRLAVEHILGMLAAGDAPERFCNILLGGLDVGVELPGVRPDLLLRYDHG